MSLRTALYTAVFTLAIAMVVTLIVFWNVYIISDYLTIKQLSGVVHGQGHPVPTAGRWTVLILGIAFLAALIAVLSLFFANMLRGARFKQQQRDFTNMVTHELRLPLSSIQVFAQTLRQRVMEPEARTRFVDGILSECARLGLLIDQLLKLRQIEQGKLPMHKAPLEGGRFLEAFVSKWPRPIKLRVDGNGSFEADPMLLELALANLVTNAEKYGRGSIPEIVFTHPGREAVFAVRDHGQPIPREQVKRIFRKFYRLPNSDTKRQPGVGLGLYIVKYITDLHRGSVHVTPLMPPDAPVEGNEFLLRLPAA